jgi:hypothetical protein
MVLHRAGSIYGRPPKHPLALREVPRRRRQRRVRSRAVLHIEHHCQADGKVGVDVAVHEPHPYAYTPSS